MHMKYLPSLEELGYRTENPYTNKLRLPLQEYVIRSRKETYTDLQGKEHLKLVAELGKYDPEPFTKLYVSAFGMLSVAVECKAAKLFFYVCSQLKGKEGGKDSVYLIYSEVRAWLDSYGSSFSYASFDRAKKMLIEAEVLAHRESAYGCRVYFINPGMLFGGSRKKYLKQQVTIAIDSLEKEQKKGSVDE